jgi:hypothetical protein
VKPQVVSMRLHGVTSHKTATVILIGVKTSNLSEIGHCELIGVNEITVNSIIAFYPCIHLQRLSKKTITLRMTYSFIIGLLCISFTV